MRQLLGNLEKVRDERSYAGCCSMLSHMLYTFVCYVLVTSPIELARSFINVCVPEQCFSLLRSLLVFPLPWRGPVQAW